MSILVTRSFELGCYVRGNENLEKLALVLPGILETKDYPHTRSHVECLAGLGYYAVSFDMPGTWESKGGIEQYTTTNCLEAISEVIDEIDKPTFIVGHSNGGRLALLASIRDPRIDACAAIMCAPTFVRPSNYEEREVIWRRDGTKTFVRDVPGDPAQTRSFVVPYSYCEDAKQYDSRDGLAELTIPKLFVAGSQDVVVAPADVRLSYDVAAEPKKFVELDTDHNYRHNPATITTMNKCLTNFAEQLVAV